MMLAATGKIDLLPSQNVAAVISAWLPRHCWTRFQSQNPIREAEPPSVQKAIASFAEHHDIRPRGEPANRGRIKNPLLKPKLHCTPQLDEPASPEHPALPAMPATARKRSKSDLARELALV